MVSLDNFVKFIVAALTYLVALSNSVAAGEYRLVRQIPIGSEGGWDYLSIDAQARRLYVTHASKVVVIDLENNRIIGEIADTPGVHGFAIAPPRGFSSNGEENKISIVDLKTLRTRSKVETGENPDAIVYEPEDAEVYAFNGRGQSATVIKAASAKVLATIPLGGKPEFAVADPASHYVFATLKTKVK